jgi:hypothetical protein
MADNLSQLLAAPLQPQREQWYSAAQAELLRTARAWHEISPDAYWTWVAEQQRWLRLLRDVVEHGSPQGDTSAMEDLAGLQAVQQAVAAEAAPTA